MRRGKWKVRAGTRDAAPRVYGDEFRREFTRYYLTQVVLGYIERAAITAAAMARYGMTRGSVQHLLRAEGLTGP